MFGSPRSAAGECEWKCDATSCGLRPERKILSARTSESVSTTLDGVRVTDVLHSGHSSDTCNYNNLAIIYMYIYIYIIIIISISAISIMFMLNMSLPTYWSMYCEVNLGVEGGLLKASRSSFKAPHCFCMY